jgi:hypothetical protein
LYHKNRENRWKNSLLLRGGDTAGKEEGRWTKSEGKKRSVRSEGVAGAEDGTAETATAPRRQPEANQRKG